MTGTFLRLDAGTATSDGRDVLAGAGSDAGAFARASGRATAVGSETPAVGASARFAGGAGSGLREGGADGGRTAATEVGVGRGGVLGFGGTLGRGVPPVDGNVGLGSPRPVFVAGATAPLAAEGATGLGRMLAFGGVPAEGAPAAAEGAAAAGGGALGFGTAEGLGVPPEVGVLGFGGMLGRGVPPEVGVLGRGGLLGLGGVPSGAWEGRGVPVVAVGGELTAVDAGEATAGGEGVVAGFGGMLSRGMTLGRGGVRSGSTEVAAG
jgi:hypothetical protein